MIFFASKAMTTSGYKSIIFIQSMTTEPRNFFGETSSDVLKRIPDELSDDAIGLWQIVKHARDFGLEEIAFNEFVRQSILAIINAGGVPVKGIREQHGKYWEPQYCFGNTLAIIADNVFIQWLFDKQEEDMGGCGSQSRSIGDH